VISPSPVSGFIRILALTLITSVIPLNAMAAISSSCSEAPVNLQVLGSGGPIADDGRASTGYLIWVNGESRYLIDSGGGVFLRFAEAGGDFSQLDLIGISHFHADHSADLPALLKSGYFANRKRELPISGPTGSEQFPGLVDYMNSLLGGENGAYRYLSGYLDGSGGLAKLRLIEVARDEGVALSILGQQSPADRVDALYVPHGIVPALAYRIRIGDKSIVFSGDQNGSDDRFIEFAKNADILVMHMVVPEGVKGAGLKLHAPPSVIGNIAAKAEVNTLVLSHFMARSLKELDRNVSIVRSKFDGSVVIANDLDCIEVID
jgi:ribonuclease BN (tRNA processing enzyme)